MRRLQHSANLYLAALVILAALLHCATLLVSTAMMWAHAGHGFLTVNLLIVGFLPALVATLLALKGWADSGARSPVYSSLGLLLLLAAMVLTHFARRVLIGAA